MDLSTMGRLGIAGLVAGTAAWIGWSLVPSGTVPLAPSGACPARPDQDSGGGACRPWKSAGRCAPRSRPRVGTLDLPLGFASVRSLYGHDDRVEVECLGDLNTGELPPRARASPALFRTDDLDKVGDDWKIKDGRATLGESEALCAGEAFADQTTGAWCSAVLVAPRKLLTAAHCVNGTMTKSKLLANFGYRIEAGRDPKHLRAAEVCTVESFDQFGEDLALVDIKCPEELAVAHMRLSDGLQPGMRVSTIGYPKGLPAKHADSAELCSVAGDLFHATLDVSSGNSGSPVFDPSGAVVGIVTEDVRAPFCLDSSAERACYRWGSLAHDSTILLEIESTRLAAERLRAPMERQQREEEE